MSLSFTFLYPLAHYIVFSRCGCSFFEEISEFYLLSLNSSHLLLYLGNLSFNADCPMLFSYASMPSTCFLVFALCCLYALLIYGVLQSHHLFCYLLSTYSLILSLLSLQYLPVISLLLPSLFYLFSLALYYLIAFCSHLLYAVYLLLAQTRQIKEKDRLHREHDGQTMYIFF